MRVELIKRAQRLGFTLGEVAVLLRLSDGKYCAETKALAEKKLAMVDEKNERLGSHSEGAERLGYKMFKGQPRVRLSNH